LKIVKNNNIGKDIKIIKNILVSPTYLIKVSDKIITINRYKNIFIVLIVKLFCTFEKVIKKQHTKVNSGI
jgi:hypothetical protein